MDLNDYQIVFMLFFAIFWGTIANVQPRWKAFQWPLFFKKAPYARNRVVLSFSILNILPLVLFGYIMYALSGIPDDFQGSWIGFIFQSVVPAFGILGLYRLWLGIIECCPDTFYAKDKKLLDSKHHHIEPTYSYKINDNPKEPVVYLGKDTACLNILFAFLYLVIACICPWFRF